MGIAAAQTQGLLNHVYGYDYHIVPKTLEEGGQPIIAPPTNGNIANAQVLSAFPNPAKSEVSFRYKLNENIEEAQLTIYDINGQLVASLSMQGSAGLVQWDAKGQPSGVYYYKADKIGGFDVPKKLVLIR